MFFWNSLTFLMIQQMLAIWSLVLLNFLKPALTSGSSWFTYCWSLVWRILSITLLACEMSAILGTTINFLKYIRIKSATHFHHCPELENKWCRQFFPLIKKKKKFPYQIFMHCASLCLTLCEPKDWNPPGFSVHGILQTGILKLVAKTSSRGSSQFKHQTHIFCIAGRFFTIELVGEGQQILRNSNNCFNVN